MSMNATPTANRTHIGFFGRRNAGKSSLMNAIAGQDLAVVSDVKGTTTDPVQKSMEILPLGPVVLIDTPGMDDDGELGALRVKKAKQAMRRSDIALVAAWMATVCDMAVRMVLMMKRYRSEKWHHIRV